MSDNNNININTPDIGPYTRLQPFRFWCQKVLPLVYDESLSYYELLCKVVDYLNKTMEDVDQMITDMGEFKTADTEFKTEVRDAYIAFSREVSQAVEGLETFVNNYFNNLDVQQEINNKLDAMAAAGYFSDLFTELFRNPVLIQAATTTSQWLANNIAEIEGYVIDKSLTVENAAADALVTGEKIRLLETITGKDLSITYIENGEDAESGSLTGEIGDTISISSSTSYCNVSKVVVPGDVFRVTFATRYDRVRHYIYFTDADDTILWVNRGDYSALPDKTGITEWVQAPAGAAKIYVTSYYGVQYVDVAIQIYKLTSSISEDVADLKYNDKMLIDRTDNLFYFTDMTDRVVSGLQLTFNNDMTVTLNGTASESVLLPIMGATAYNERIVESGTTLSIKRFAISGTFGDVVSLRDSSGGISNQVKTFDQDEYLYVRVNPSTYVNAKVGFVVVEGETQAENYYPHISGFDYISRKNADQVPALDARVARLEENEPVIPSYYVDYIAEKKDDINELLNINVNSGVTRKATDVEEFIFFTDYHYDGTGVSLDNTQNSAPLIDYLLRNTGCNLVVHGGDIINNLTDQEAVITYFNSFLKQFDRVKNKMYSCIGNHEYNSTDPLTFAQIHEIINGKLEYTFADMDEYGDYYVINKAKKTVYFYMGCDRRTTGSVMMSTGQIEWFLTELSNVPAGYSIILFIHRFLQLQFDALTETITAEPSNLGTADAKAISDGIDAYVGRTSYMFNSNTYDYTGANGTFICVFCGHSHYDASYTTSEGVPVIMTTTDCCPKRHTSYDWQTETWVNGCTPGTIEEQAFDYVTIDKEHKTIKCTRIGYGSDRSFTY